MADVEPVGRTCTDCIWVPIFVTALGLLGCTLSHALEHGDFDRLYALPDFEGRLCGIGGRGQFAYMCGTGSQGALDWHRRVCVEACPMGNGTSMSCGRFGGGFQEIVDYPTYAFAGILCMPLDRSFTQQLLAGHPTVERLNLERVAVWSDIRRAWPLLLLSAALAVALAFAYMSSLRAFAECLLRLGCIVAVLAPGVLGGCMLFSALHDSAGTVGDAGAALEFMGYVGPSSGDVRIDAFLGACGAAASLFLACLTCTREKQISLAIECIDKASSCISSYPSLLCQPFISLFLKATLMAPLSVGFVLLLSCQLEGQVDVGSGGTFVLPAEQAAQPRLSEFMHVAYYCLMLVWTFELSSALSHFVVAYNVQGWHFSGRQDIEACSGIAHGYYMGLCHHLGSLIFGSLCIPFARPLRPLSSQLRHVHRNAYLDMALSSRGFCDAGRQTQKVLGGNSVAQQALTGAAFLFVMAGLAGMAAAGAALTWWMARSWSAFAEPSSSFYIEEPFYPCIASAVLSLLVAWPFLSTLDTVADSILFCEGFEALALEVGDEEEQLVEGATCCGMLGRSRGYAPVPQIETSE